MIDLSGQIFDCLTVVTKAGKDSRGNITWNCQCSCGNTLVVKGCHLRSGHSKSCGCLQKASASKRAVHGHLGGDTSTTEYNSWRGMINRCSNPKYSGYKNYGGRGIKVCERWRDFASFYADMGKKPSSNFSIERVNNNGNYESGNCIWATRNQQSANQRPRATKSSRYKGVSWDSQYQKWRAQTRINGVRKSIGRFDSEEEAFLAIQRNGLAFHWPEQEDEDGN